MTRLYRYIGAAELARIQDDSPERTGIHSPADIRDWVTGTYPWASGKRMFTVTFVIAVDGALWIADRHSEHVQCARGEPVLSAGEMTFAPEGQSLIVTDVSNQSTGYCPEPASWPAVAIALNNAGIVHPGRFTETFVFRRCEVCGMINIVKDEFFACGVCQSELPERYNCS